MLICDVGGGTTDCALFKREAQGPVPIGLSGMAFGGEDITDMLSEYGEGVQGLNWEDAKMNLGSDTVGTTLRQFGVSMKVDPLRSDFKARLSKKLSLVIDGLKRFTDQHLDTAPHLEHVDLQTPAQVMVLVTGGSAKLSFGRKNGTLVDLIGALVQTFFPNWSVDSFSPKEPKACTALGVAHLAQLGQDIDSLSNVLPFDVTTSNAFGEDVVLGNAGTFLDKTGIELNSTVGNVRQLYARFVDGAKYLVREFDPPQRCEGRLTYEPESGHFDIETQEKSTP
jgi:hypothetical protein